MIFITVGTTRFPFVRMAHIFEAVCGCRHKNELIIFQHGATPMETTANNVVVVPYLNFIMMNRYLRQARVIICHGGPATIYQALSYGKVPWVLPREKQIGEHVDDHQVCFCRYLERKHHVYLIEDLAVLREKINDVVVSRVRRRELAFSIPLIQYLDSCVK